MISEFAMKLLTLRLIAALASTLPATAAPAAELVLGLGHSFYNYGGGRDSTVVSLELRGPAIGHLGRAEVSPLIVGDRHRLGDSFVGIGLAARWQLRRGWFVDVSVAPGKYRASSPANALGSDFEFRSHVGLGHDLGKGRALSAAFVHKSNAGIGRINPGLQTVLLRWHQRF